MTGNLVNKALVKGYKGRPFQAQFKQEWLQVKLTSQAGTGHIKTWIRHQNGKLPSVILIGTCPILLSVLTRLLLDTENL